MKSTIRVKNPILPESVEALFDWKRNPANVFYLIVPLYMLGSFLVLAWAIMIDLRSGIPLATGTWVVMNSALGFLIFFEIQKLYRRDKQLKQLYRDTDRLLSQPLPKFQHSQMTEIPRAEIRIKTQEKRSAWLDTKFGDE